MFLGTNLSVHCHFGLNNWFAVLVITEIFLEHFAQPCI